MSRPAKSLMLMILLERYERSARTCPLSNEISLAVTARLDTDIEVDYYANGGILPYVLRKMVREG
jgi:aconitase A